MIERLREMATARKQGTDQSDEKWVRIHPDVEIFRPEDGPARDVLNGRRTLVVTGHFSYKMLLHVPCEGRGEEKVARALDCIHPAKGYYGQPESIRFSVDPEVGTVTYTPDFGVRFSCGYVRFEYKRLEDLLPPLPDPKDEYALLRWAEAEEMRARLRRVREAYRRAGLTWVLLTDIELSKAASASVVNELVANFGRPISEDDLGRLMAELSHSGSLPLGKCEELIREGDFPRGDVLSRIAENLIRIDLHQPISVDTVVHIGT
jgi:hypothetical protein